MDSTYIITKTKYHKTIFLYSKLQIDSFCEKQRPFLN